VGLSIVTLFVLTLQYGLMLLALVGLVKAVRGLRKGGARLGLLRGAPWFVVPWFVVWAADGYGLRLLSHRDIKQGWRVSLILGAVAAAVLLFGALVSRRRQPD
jgi:hypothetical protein